MSEGFADGLGTHEEVVAAGRAVVDALSGCGNRNIGYAAADAAFGSFDSYHAIAALETSDQPCECRVHCDLLRDIYGNPFRPVVFNPSWLTWNDSTILKLARAIYDERAFDRLPILADALEEAGCTDADTLNHCRQPGEHVRGCWIVDLLLGKS